MLQRRHLERQVHAAVKLRCLRERLLGEKKIAVKRKKDWECRRVHDRLTRIKDVGKMEEGGWRIGVRRD